MNPKVIDAEHIVPTKYSHIHDSKLLFRSYKENFDFGLTVDQYYFNQSPRDKKTNYNTQYTITNLQPLSTIVELDIPFKEELRGGVNHIRSFTTTIQHGGKYLRNDYSDTSAISSIFDSSSNFDNLDERFFFTVTLTSTLIEDKAVNPTGYEHRITISQDYNDSTYYLKSPGTSQNAVTQFSSTVSQLSTFAFQIENNKFSFFSQINPDAANPKANVAVLSTIGDFSYLWWKEPGAWQSTSSTASASWFDITRHVLTKNYKTLPNSYVKYTSSFNTDTVDLNTSTITEQVSNNYLFFTNNYNFYDGEAANENIKTNHIDFFPLKNQATLHEYYAENNHFNSEPGYLNRIYDKINAGTHQQRGTDKIGLSYNIGTYDIVFKPNKLTYFTTPNSIAPYTVLNIADSKIETIGSVPGDNPLMSDKVFKRRANIKNNSFSDDTDPTYLCSWLSGNESGDTKWVDRYYNPKISTFATALSTASVSSVSSTSHFKVLSAVKEAGGFVAGITETFDVSSSLTFEPNNDYMFYHVGSKDYENLFDVYNTKYNTASAIEYTNHKGVPIIPRKSKKDDELILNGGNYGKFKSDEVGDFSTNFWLHTKDNSQPFAYQLIGNYFEEGFGIFNTDLVTPNIILPVENKSTKVISKLMFLNNQFEVYDEVTLREDGVDVAIKGIGRKDIFSELYVLGANNIIYIYNSNNNLISKIENLKDTSSTIDDFEVGENKLHVLFNPVKDTQGQNAYFTYRMTDGKTFGPTSSDAATVRGEKGRVIENRNGTAIYSVDPDNGYGNEISFDSNLEAHTVRRFSPNSLSDTRNYVQQGSSPLTYTDTKRVVAGVGVASKVNGVIVDDQDDIIIVHDNNVISILDKNRVLKRTREFCQIDNETFEQTYIDLIYDFESGVYKKYILLIQEYANGFRLTKLNDDLNIIDSKRFYDINLGDLNLTKTVTSYSYLRKIGAKRNQLKVILKPKKKYHSSGLIPKEKIEIEFDYTQLNNGYNHFFINVSLRKGFMELFVNGRRFKKQTFKAGDYSLDNILGTGCYVGAVSTPFYLTLANRLLQPRKYFVRNCKIKGFKLYNKIMNYFDIMAHYNYHLPNKNLIWSYPIGQRTYVDTIDKLMKFSFPEKLSNKYKVEIENTNITDQILRDKLVRRIKNELVKITPYFDEIEDVVIS